MAREEDQAAKVVTDVLTSRYGLLCGSDFTTSGYFEGDVRTGTVVNVFSGVAHQTVADHADEIELSLAERGHIFHVSIRYTQFGGVQQSEVTRPRCTISTMGTKVREDEPRRKYRQQRGPQTAAEVLRTHPRGTRFLYLSPIGVVMVATATGLNEDGSQDPNSVFWNDPLVGITVDSVGRVGSIRRTARYSALIPLEEALLNRRTLLRLSGWNFAFTSYLFARGLPEPYVVRAKLARFNEQRGTLDLEIKDPRDGRGTVTKATVSVERFRAFWLGASS